MYRHYYDLRHRPFELTPDSETLYLGESHKEALSVLRYGVISNKGFLVLTGGIGTGKTTLVNVLAQSLDCPGHLCILSSPTLEIADFYYYLSAKLGLPFDGNKAKFLLLFAELVEECRTQKGRILLIVDEAQALSVELLEEIRFLANVSLDAWGVLSIFLVGQPELLDHLATPRLLPLRQRIAIRNHIEPLSREDAVRYIVFRLEKAGGRGRSIFSEKAMAMIHQATGGNPRLINILCDNALVTGYAGDAPIIDEKIVRSCVEELRIPGDAETFALLPARKYLRWIWIGIGAAIATAEILGIYAAYRTGWLERLRQYLF